MLIRRLKGTKGCEVEMQGEPVQGWYSMSRATQHCPCTNTTSLELSSAGRENTVPISYGSPLGNFMLYLSGASAFSEILEKGGVQRVCMRGDGTGG